MEHWVKWVNNQNIFSLCLPETRSWQLLTYIRVNKAIATYFRDPKRKRLLKYWSCNGERGTHTTFRLVYLAQSHVLIKIRDAFFLFLVKSLEK